MPNHCSNNLTVHGPEADINRFLETVKSPHKDNPERVDYEIYKNIVPCPQELIDTISGGFADKDEQAALEAREKQNLEKFGYKNWYDWCYSNWGTKWGDYDTQLLDQHSVGDGNSVLSFSFDTAWGPGLEGIARISAKFPTLKFLNSYEEGGMCFLGAFGAVNGEIVIETEGTYPELDGGFDDDGAWEQQNDALCEERERCEIVVGEFIGIWEVGPKV